MADLTTEELDKRKLAAANAYVASLKAENAHIRRERDAYKKAKEENDERFMGERDTARRERDEARAKLDDATRYCTGEFPCEASTSAASLERERNDLEATLAEVLQYPDARRAYLENQADSSGEGG